jgi:hypothetical protein
VGCAIDVNRQVPVLDVIERVVDQTPPLLLDARMPIEASLEAFEQSR